MKIFSRILSILTAVIAGLLAAKVFIAIFEYIKEIWDIEEKLSITQTLKMWLKFDFQRFSSLYIVFVVISIIILLISCCHECSHKLKIHSNQEVLEEHECAYERLK
ncbi:MAG: hypothetical protein LBT27_08555 [Prevotellaceae bacterium]|jgi:hypothetical protein|nr:hypothetical protein [Prevotellaceae bacterium]